MHSELAGLVAARADHTSRPRVAADDHGLAAQLRPIALLPRREERVEVDVDYAEAADGHARMMARSHCLRQWLWQLPSATARGRFGEEPSTVAAGPPRTKR